MVGFSREPDSILMAYCPLGSLDGLLKYWKSRKVLWTKRLIASLARDLAKGLFYLHKAGIAHLDLKVQSSFSSKFLARKYLIAL
jgi:serine/threonine protein kinase